MSLDDHCLTENVTISDITSFFGGVSAVSVQQMKGTTRNVVIRNVTAADQGEDRSRACYEIINGENIQLYNCSSLRARGDAFRATGTGKNISVQHCFEQQTAGSPYVGYFDHLELNNRVIVP